MSPTGLLIIRIHRIRWSAFSFTVLVAAFFIQAWEVWLSVQFKRTGKGCKQRDVSARNRIETTTKLMIIVRNTRRFMETSSRDRGHRLVTVRFLSVLDLIESGNSVCHQNFRSSEKPLAASKQASP